MCGRLIGTAFGEVWRDASGDRAARSMANLRLFRWAREGEPTIAFSGSQRLRCLECGGFAVMEEISISVGPEVAPVEAGACMVHNERMRGAGRRPRGCTCLRSLQKAA
jgi:hypothetical protein